MTLDDFHDDFGIVRKNTGGLGGGAPQKKFSILGAKILLKNQKKKLTNNGGVKTTVKISRSVVDLVILTIKKNEFLSSQ